jgi:hypothetical protein
MKDWPRKTEGKMEIKMTKSHVLCAKRFIAGFLFFLIASFSLRSEATVNAALVRKITGQYKPASGCQITTSDGRQYSKFFVMRGIPEYPDLDLEFLGVFGIPKAKENGWSQRRAFVKLNEINEVQRMANGGDAYNRLFQQTDHGFEILIQPCALGFCHSWQKEGELILLENGNLKISLDGDHQEAQGQGSCTLIRIPHSKRK